MIVCLCRRVSEGAIAAAIAEGARNVEQIASVTGAGTDCGCCRDTVEAMAASAGAVLEPALSGLHARGAGSKPSGVAAAAGRAPRGALPHSRLRTSRARGSDPCRPSPRSRS